MADRFGHFAAIDWSGAAGERHHGIAVAICGADGEAPMIVRPGHRWSRGEVLDWLGDEMPAVNSIGRKWSMLCEIEEFVGRAGRKPTLHDLRHTFATRCVSSGMDVKTLQSSNFDGIR